MEKEKEGGSEIGEGRGQGFLPGMDGWMQGTPSS